MRLVPQRLRTGQKQKGAVSLIVSWGSFSRQYGGGDKMSEKSVMIPSGSISLEACYAEGSQSGPEAVILCHPHPLYGGNMDNNVVLALQRTFNGLEWATMRFNFRSAGRSGGEFGEGQGETQDVLAVAAYLKEKGKRILHVAAYSFGAWIALKAIAQGFEPVSAVLVSPPLEFLDFSALRLPHKPCLISLGDRDSFCSVQTLRNWLAVQKADEAMVDMEILQGCDHFYWGHEEILFDMVSGFLRKHFQSPV
jgi:alpha/beta superfamily hydrolase